MSQTGNSLSYNVYDFINSKSLYQTRIQVSSIEFNTIYQHQGPLSTTKHAHNTHAQAYWCQKTNQLSHKILLHIKTKLKKKKTLTYIIFIMTTYPYYVHYDLWGSESL